jgi:uncharacterized protein involved in exopolysaccharide biosynthesis
MEMRAEMAVTPEMATLPPAQPRERALERASADVEPALIGRILWRRRRWIAAAAAAAVVGTLVYCLLATPQYTAVAQILVDPRDKQVVSNDVNPSSIAADGGVTQVESQGSVLQSSGVLLRAIAATDLDGDPEFNGSSFFASVARVVSLWLRPSDPSHSADRLKAETLQTLRKHLSVKRADKVLVLDLTVRARTPERAAEIANAIADAYLADQADARAAASLDASKALTNRLDELQASVRKAEDEVEDYRAAHDFVVSSGQLVSDQEINQTTAQLAAAQSRTASLKAQLDQLRRNAGAQGTPEAMASGVMVRLRDRESAIVEKLASASKQLGPRHPDLASMQQSLSDVRGLIAKETQRLRQAAQADYARALDDENGLREKLDGMKTKSLDDSKADVRWRELQRQAEVARSIYQAFLVRARETLEAANVDTTNARVITHALPPVEKSWPPTLLLVLGAGVLGLSLGASGSLAHEYLRPTLLTLRQARDLLDAPALGLIAASDLHPAATFARSSADAAARIILRCLAPGETGKGAALGRCVYVASTPAAALYRARLAERIAALAARDGREALLIDGDFSGPSADDRPGLLELFSGEQSVADLAYRGEDERFSRLAKGVGDPFAAPPHEGTDAFRLRRVRRCYDLVVIDAGAFADNHRLAPLAAGTDFVALVALLGEPQAQLAGEAESAEAAGGRIDGFALVDAGA